MRAALSPFWVVPALWCAAAVVLGIVVPEVERQNYVRMPLLFAGGTDGARALLSTIAGAMISVTGLVFSITIVVLQLASSQFSPRVLRTFLDDRIPQNTLGVFAASFLYALTVLRSVIDSGVRPGSSSVPQVAISLAYALVLASVAMFLWFIHHITRSISVGSVVGQLSAETRHLVERNEDVHRPVRADRAPRAHPAAQHVVVASGSGVLDLVDRRALVRTASDHDGHVEVLHRRGTFVPEGAPLALVHADAAGTDWDDPVCRALHLAAQRSLQQDVSFGIRQLVDIAERALSPGINDPTTAVQVLDQLHDLLRRIGSLPDADPTSYDDDGAPRLTTREWTFADLLDLSVDEIAHWGAGGVQVPRRLELLFADLEHGVDPSHRETVMTKADGVRRVLAGR